MRRFVIRRVVFAVLAVIAATAVVFVLSRAAGDPLLLYATPGYGLTPEQEAALRKRLHLDRALPMQYLLWLGDAVRGDLGETILDRKPVTRIITQRFPATVQLAVVAWVLATAIGVPLGVLSAVKRGSVLDYFGRGFALFGQAIPSFWLGLMLMLVVAVNLRWLPVSTRGDGSWDLPHFILPSITLAAGSMAGYLRLTRTAMLEILDSEYIKMARAKGVHDNTVIWKHAFRNALIQPLTASTLILAGLLTGSVVVEQIFVWPGMGQMAITAVTNNDFPILLGVVLMFTALYVGVIFLTDIAYAIIDPRDQVRLEDIMREEASAQVERAAAARPVEVDRERRALRRNFLSQAWYFLRRWPLLPLIVVVGLVVVGAFAPVLAPTGIRDGNLNYRHYPPTWGQARPQNVAPDQADFDVTTSSGRSAYSRAVNQHFPRTVYILGADHLGRDILSRVIWGARISLQVVAIALISGILIGSAMGIVAGYFGGWIDEVLMRFVDIWLALPFILLALVIAVVFGATLGVVMVLLAMLAWTPFVRQVRADVLTIRSRDYVLSAKITGASIRRILLRHVLPGTFSTILVVASLRTGSLILAESILSFLGVGIPDPIPAWGKSVNDGRPYLDTAWWVSFFPGLAIFLVVMSLNFFGDWLRDRLDPRLRQLD